MIGIWDKKSGRLEIVVPSTADAESHKLRGKEVVDLPDDYDPARYSFAFGKLSPNVEGRKACASGEYGEVHVALAHARKAIEARSILLGHDAPYPLLAAEADVRDVEIVDLARSIVAKDEEFIALELARVRAMLAV